MPATLVLRNEATKAKAHEWVNIAPPDTVVTFKKPKRSTPQNDRMWAMLTIVSNECEWHGMKYPPEDWKDYFFHSLKRGKFMPDENGGYVPVGMSTSRLNKQDHSDLTMIIEEFCARNEIDLGEH